MEWRVYLGGMKGWVWSEENGGEEFRDVVKFVGVGEKMDDVEVFDGEKYV